VTDVHRLTGFKHVLLLISEVSDDINVRSFILINGKQVMLFACCCVKWNEHEQC